MKKYEITKTMKQIETENLFYFSTGNKKLKSNEKVLFLIWSLPAVDTCPYATDLCIANCYARKAEIAYPDCLPSRIRNYNFSKTENFVSEVINYISIKLNNLKNGRKIIVRIHESGDFYSTEYLKKWLAIIGFFADDDRIKFVTYTKSVRFFKETNFQEFDNFTVRYSIWADTKEDEKAIAKSLSLPIYTAYTRDVMDAIEYKFHECRCSDCATCQCCFNRKVETIICEIH